VLADAEAGSGIEEVPVRIEALTPVIELEVLPDLPQDESNDDDEENLTQDPQDPDVTPEWWSGRGCGRHLVSD
jgi:hypothetical protein